MTLKHAFLGVMAASLLAFACDVDRSGSDPAGYYFTGVVYDGVTGDKLEDYTVTLTQAGEADLVAKSDKDTGAYMVGPLKPGSDFVVTIDAGEDYRAFFAAEAMKTSLPNTADDQQTQYYEAYVFPTGLESPAVTFDIFAEDSTTARPSGKVRFAPAGNGVSALSLTTVTSAVGTQTWANDADRKAATVTLNLEDGVVDVEAGALVYGVNYSATVYDVSGHAYDDFTFTAGINGTQTVVLNELSNDTTDLTAADDGLQLIYNSLNASAYNEDGTVTLTFNQALEFGVDTPEDVVKEWLDDGITYVPAGGIVDDADNVCSLSGVLWDATLDKTVAATNNYVEDDAGKSERGTSISIKDNVLTISWPDRAGAFETALDGADAACNTDELTRVTYNIAGITVRLVGDEDDKLLSTLIGANTVSVNIGAPTAD